MQQKNNQMLNEDGPLAREKKLPGWAVYWNPYSRRYFPLQMVLTFQHIQEFLLTASLPVAHHEFAVLLYGLHNVTVCHSTWVVQEIKKF